MFEPIEKVFSPPRNRAEYERLKAIDDVFGKIGVFMVFCMLMYFLYRIRHNIYASIRNFTAPQRAPQRPQAFFHHSQDQRALVLPHNQIPIDNELYGIYWLVDFGARDNFLAENHRNFWNPLNVVNATVFFDVNGNPIPPMRRQPAEIAPHSLYNPPTGRIRPSIEEVDSDEDVDSSHQPGLHRRLLTHL